MVVTVMDVLDLLRRYSGRLARWWLLAGAGVGLAVGWGVAHTDCVLKWRGGGCFIELPGERTLLGAVGWGLLAGLSVAILLRFMARFSPSSRPRDRRHR
jgi:hypothetical protein